jgi:hypothetical protein
VENIADLLRELRMPIVTTLHTVLREPRADQRRVMQELISLSTRLVVMAERGRQMLAISPRLAPSALSCRDGLYVDRVNGNQGADDQSIVLPKYSDGPVIIEVD